MVDIVPALFIDKRTRRLWGGRVALDNLRQFRQFVFNHDTCRTYKRVGILSADEFDRRSLHVVCMKDTEILGATRIVPVHHGMLPFSFGAPQLCLEPYDIELGRFVVRPDASGNRAFSYLLMGVIQFLKKHKSLYSGRIFADVILSLPRTIKREKYLEFGFNSTDITYTDDCYSAKCEIFSLEQLRLLDSFKTVFHYFVVNRIYDIDDSAENVVDTYLNAIYGCMERWDFETHSVDFNINVTELARERVRGHAVPGRAFTASH